MKKPRPTDAERCPIEAGLRERKTPHATAKSLKRPIRTIVREIKGRAVESDKGAAYRIKNRCVHSMDCTRRLVCGGCIRPERKQCRFCPLCNAHCPDYVENVRARLSSPPHVCNGCGDERKCVLRKRYHIASSAHENHREVLVESRRGANITEAEAPRLDRPVHHFTRNGQSIHAAMVAHGEVRRAQGRRPVPDRQDVRGLPDVHGREPGTPGRRDGHRRGRQGGARSS